MFSLFQAETIIRALGPLALESSPLASGEGFTGAGTCHSSTWIASIVETIMAKFTGCRGLLEMETALLGILQVAVQIEPGAILPTLQEQVEQVVIKITRETAKKLSAERMHEIRSQFVDWMSALKQIYHTRPAVVAENVRKIWERVRIPHTRRTWPAGENGGVATQESDMPRSLYRVRGPSLSSEWESVVSDLKNRVGRKASIWRDVKAAGIAQ